MGEHSYKFNFTCEISIVNGKFRFVSYFVKKEGTKNKKLNIEPPPIFRSVIFDIMQEYNYYGGSLNIDHTIAYLHLERPEECDLVCIDVAMLEPEHKIDRKRAIVPSKYDLYKGIEEGGSSFFYGDVYNSIINANWSNNRAIKLLKRDSSNSHWSQNAGIVDLHFSVTRVKTKFKFKGFFIIRRHVLGEIAGIALIPIYPKKNEVPKHAIVASHWNKDRKGRLSKNLSSEAWSNLKNLAQLLEYRGAQTIWIFGEPGSGKEVFAQALHAGSVVGRGNMLKIRSAAGVKLEEFNQRLFSSRINDKCLIEQVDGGGTIFLDEFDKLDKDNVKPICSTLLRVLEADEYIKVTTGSGSNKRESLAKLDKVNWIFAGAFSTSDTQDFPSDFWTRLTGALTITNPISNSKEYAANLFLYFYVAETIRALGPRYEISIENFISLLERKPNNRKFNEQITADILGIGDNYLKPNEQIIPPNSLIDFITKFSRTVKTAEDKTKKTKIDSSRGIRQAAKAAFFVMRQSAIEDGDSFQFSLAAELAIKAAHEMLATSRGL